MSMSSFCCSSHKQLEASTSLEACPRTRQRSRSAEVLSSVLQCLVSVTRSEVVRDGSHPLPTRGSHARCKSELSVCTISWVVSRMCECTMSVHSRTVIVLWKKWISIVLHKCRFPSWILSFGFQLCLRLAESSAQSSSQSEVVTRSSSRCIRATVGDGRMVALQCHDVLLVCSDTRLLPTEPPTQDQSRRLPMDQLSRRVLVRVRTDVSVRSEEPSRVGSKSSVALASPL